tara:strand:+ start:2124 stop:2417 length:294 start_codon:yes stop_codon:yes gene_type:complete
MRRIERPSGQKLHFLKENRKQNLVRKLLDIDLRGVDHKVYITKDSRADLTVNDGRWITDYIRKTIMMHNYQISKIPKLQVKDFKAKEIKAFEEQVLV